MTERKDLSQKIPTGFSFVFQDNTSELDTDRQDELQRARRLGEEEEEKSRKSALLFGSEDTFDSIASLEEKVCELWCTFMIQSFIPKATAVLPVYQICLLSAFQVPCLFPLDFSEARAVFLVGQNHVKKVKYHLIYIFFFML